MIQKQNFIPKKSQKTVSLPNPINFILKYQRSMQCKKEP
jgi:hypothetical protein